MPMIESKPGVQFADLYQMAYVTTDLDRAMEVFRTRHGIPAFKDLGAVSLARDDGGTAHIRFAICFVGPVQLEIIEPRGGDDALYRHVLPAAGFGLSFHHIACKVASEAALDTLKGDLQRDGHTIAMSGGVPGAARFFYVDARATLGHYIEYLFLSPDRLAFHQTLPRY
jgi:hypothetical protein